MSTPRRARTKGRCSWTTHSFVDPDDAQVAVERQDEAAFVVEIDADLLVERLREHDHDEVVVMLSEEEKYLTTANGLAELSRRIAHPADR